MKKKVSGENSFLVENKIGEKSFFCEKRYFDTFFLANFFLVKFFLVKIYLV